MNQVLEKYLVENYDAFYIGKDGKKYPQSIHGKSYVRFNKAKEQSQKKIVGINQIIKYVNELFSEVGLHCLDNPIMIPTLIDYTQIKEKFQLHDERDIVWMKFTKDGYLGVVATSNDINFEIPLNSRDYDVKRPVYNTYLKKYVDSWVYNTSGIIVHKLGKEWDESFVLVFPLCNIPNGYTRGDIEKAVGNYLIKKDVPILDFYSHIY